MVRGGKVCRVYSFLGTKVPGNERSRQQMFQGTNSLENECSSIHLLLERYLKNIIQSLVYNIKRNQVRVVKDV